MITWRSAPGGYRGARVQLERGSVALQAGQTLATATVLLDSLAPDGLAEKVAAAMAAAAEAVIRADRTPRSIPYALTDLARTLPRSTPGPVPAAAQSPDSAPVTHAGA